ncbi:MAG TPA: amidohydrolase family protein [Jatrophihabitans sp.]|nr:amidohydrolase family protein [Jatrophihabitans sp.]
MPAVVERPRRVAVRAARLFDSVSATIRRRPLLIVDGPTLATVDFGVDPPPDSELHDLGDVTLLPGLVDAHLHLAFDASPDPAGALAARSDDEATAAMTVAARTAAQAGLTTVRDLGDRGYRSLGLRGADDLPTILAAGPPLTRPDGHCHYLGGCVAPGPGGMRAAVREHAERGVDVVKIMASGGTLTPGTYQHEPQFEVAELRAAVDEAHRLGLPVTAHAHATAAIVNALDAGVDGIEHVTFWTQDSVESPPEVLDRIARCGVAVGATLGVRPPVAGTPGPPMAVAARVPLMIANIGRLYQAGARIAPGSDGGIGPAKPHDVLPHAAAMLARAGVPAAECLALLTRGAAEGCGLGDRKGRLAAGYDADVLAVAGDPTTEPAALHEVRAVYLRGRRIR